MPSIEHTFGSDTPSIEHTYVLTIHLFGTDPSDDIVKEFDHLQDVAKWLQRHDCRSTGRRLLYYSEREQLRAKLDFRESGLDASYLF